MAELQRQQEVCLRKLNLPDVPLPDYPSPISLKTPPSVELEGEEVEYYLDKFEEIKRRDQQAAMAHMRRLEEIEESEQQRRCHIPMAEYERRSRIQRQRIDYALSEKGKKPRPPKIPLESPPKSSHSKNVTPEPDYLDLVPVAGPGQSPEITRRPRPDLVTPEQAGVGVKTPQNVPNEPLSIEGSGKLPIEGPKVSESETSPTGTRQYKQVVPYQPIWPDRGDKRELIHPLGGNTIPIKYSKEIGRNGGIERPTSTEALDSQNNALEAVK